MPFSSARKDESPEQRVLCLNGRNVVDISLLVTRLVGGDEVQTLSPAAGGYVGLSVAQNECAPRSRAGRIAAQAMQSD